MHVGITRAPRASTLVSDATRRRAKKGLLTHRVPDSKSWHLPEMKLDANVAEGDPREKRQRCAPARGAQLCSAGLSAARGAVISHYAAARRSQEVSAR